MTSTDSRQVGRDSLFLLAQLRVDGHDTLYRVKVRNISARGLMAEGPVEVARGTPVSIELREIGWVEGSVAWKQDSRFGIAFVEEIDPSQIRTPFADGPGYEAPRHARPAAAPPGSPDPAKLRKI